MFRGEAQKRLEDRLKLYDDKLEELVPRGARRVVVVEE